jgi:hypothetical protein
MQVQMWKGERNKEPRTHSRIDENAQGAERARPQRDEGGGDWQSDENAPSKEKTTEPEEDRQHGRLGLSS